MSNGSDDDGMGLLPEELYPDLIHDDDWDDEMNWDEEEPDEDFCPWCDKNIFDFSDMGCGHCDRRSPEWGLLD